MRAHAGRKHYSIDEARAAKTKALRIFKQVAPVVGVGITKIDGSYGIKVNVREKPRRGVTVPDSIDGVPVKVEVVGPIRKR